MKLDFEPLKIYIYCVVILMSILLNRNLQQGIVKLALWKERLQII